MQLHILFVLGIDFLHEGGEVAVQLFELDSKVIVLPEVIAGEGFLLKGDLSRMLLLDVVHVIGDAESSGVEELFLVGGLEVMDPDSCFIFEKIISDVNFLSLAEDSRIWVRSLVDKLTRLLDVHLALSFHTLSNEYLFSDRGNISSPFSIKDTSC